MANKKTKREFYGELRELVGGNAELVAFIDHELELLDKKSNSKTPTKTQQENENIMVTIKNELAQIGRPVTITELQGESEELASYSNQKLSALLKKLVDTNQVVKVVDKKKSYFSIAE